MSPCDALLAFGSGRPPASCNTAAAAEAWALLTVLNENAFVPNVRTDCLSLLSAAMAGTTNACGSDKALARIWKQIAEIVGDDVSSIVTSGKLVWMPAHLPRSRVGQTKLSNAVKLSPSDWRANRLVDILAKRAAAFHQITAAASASLSHAASLSQWALAQVARVTHFANNCEVTITDADGHSSTKMARDSMEKPKFAKANSSRKRAAPAPQHKPRDISAVAPWMPEPVLEGRARASKVRRCAAMQRTKAANLQVASAITRMGGNLKQASTFEQSDAKRARLLARVQERQALALATA